MGSSDITSWLVAQTTEDTGLVPAGVTAARPVADEAGPDGEADPPADPVHAAPTIVPAAGAAMTAARLCLRFIPTPGLRQSFGKLYRWRQATSRIHDTCSAPCDLNPARPRTQLCA